MKNEDLGVFFNTYEFADEATFDGSNTVIGIFDNDYVDSQGVTDTGPVFMCESTDVPDPVNKTLVVNSSSYVIRDSRVDSGVVTLVLERA